MSTLATLPTRTLATDILASMLTRFADAAAGCDWVRKAEGRQALVELAKLDR